MSAHSAPGSGKRGGAGRKPRAASTQAQIDH
jgi:hypothetical protein